MLLKKIILGLGATALVGAGAVACVKEGRATDVD